MTWSCSQVKKAVCLTCEKSGTSGQHRTQGCAALRARCGTTSQQCAVQLHRLTCDEVSAPAGGFVCLLVTALARSWKVMKTNLRSRTPIALLSNETATTCDLDTCERTLVGKTPKRSTVSCALEFALWSASEVRRCRVLRKACFVTAWLETWRK